MTINSKNKFSFVTEDNFFELINEKIEGNVLKVCASLTQEEQSYGNDDKLVIQDDFDSYDEFEIKKNREEKEEKKLEEPNQIK